jgi:hypothetical protein
MKMIRNADGNKGGYLLWPETLSEIILGIEREQRKYTGWFWRLWYNLKG